MAQIFLSYAREDRECAELFARELSARGWTVWWDRRIQVGRSFSEVIERELDEASCVIVLWSRHAVTSPWVQTEAAEAAQRRVLVPVRIEDVRMPLEFRRLQTADLFEWRTRLDGPELEDCLASIELLASKDTTSTRPVRLVEPQPKQAASTENTRTTSESVHQATAGSWISQDGQQFQAPDLDTLILWVKEGRVRADAQVYDSSRQRWIRASEVAGLRSAFQEQRLRTQASPSELRKSNRGRNIALGCGGLLLMLVLVVISVASHDSDAPKPDTAATETSGTMAATDTVATDTASTDTAVTGTTGTMSTTSTSTFPTDTATTGIILVTPISVSLQNDCAKTVSVAICYKDSRGNWITEGWFNVEPNKSSPDVVRAYGRDIYFYAYARGSTWAGKEGGDMTAKIPIKKPDQFRAFFGELKGDGVQTVPFFGKTVEEGQSAYTLPRFTCD